jgi:hypothetical protein
MKGKILRVEYLLKKWVFNEPKDSKEVFSVSLVFIP